MVEAAIRHGANEYTTLKWNATIEAKDYFEQKMKETLKMSLLRVMEILFKSIGLKFR
ncbi:hypothetical protein [Anaerosalibacter massiliensis]|uniref:hypothetical protein n=1 Tax=Anaerosalibacter massiliensis TaxID=1347392 RepID=UPI00164D45C8|nr:hypothetical protein [Anaerosalibacter massiliensis]